MGEQFTQLMSDFKCYLIVGLTSPNEVSLCRAAIHSTADLVRAMKKNFAQYIDQIIPLIFNILRVNLKLHRIQVQIEY